MWYTSDIKCASIGTLLFWAKAHYGGKMKRRTECLAAYKRAVDSNTVPERFFLLSALL